MNKHNLSVRDTNPKDALSDRKAPLSTVPMAMVAWASMQMHRGAGKYGLHNYRARGVRASVYYEGILRHLLDWWNGNDFDEEGVANIAGICANVAILSDAAMHGYMVDNRPPSVDFRHAIQMAEMQAISNIEFNKGREVTHYTIADPTFCAEAPQPAEVK